MLDIQTVWKEEETITNVWKDFVHVMMTHTLLRLLPVYSVKSFNIKSYSLSLIKIVGSCLSYN